MSSGASIFRHLIFKFILSKYELLQTLYLLREVASFRGNAESLTASHEAVALMPTQDATSSAVMLWH